MTIAFDNSYARLPADFYARIDPDPAPEPSLIKVNHGLAADLGLDAAWLESDEGIAMLSGALVTQGSEPLAMAYAGHQFGGWSHQLGDGRAHLLGEIVAPDAVRYDIQLKGSGRTPFSRNGDGKAALGPVLREYIVSEFMAAVGVPTTRALAAVQTGERVQRETGMPGAVLTRVAQSHVRVGTFQYFYAREQTKNTRTLADYVIDRHYPKAREQENPMAAMLACVVERQARLIAQWMGLGFIHGVMNTDNMQIAGETIDYGPCAFMDVFHPSTVFSSIDRGGRYAWANQPNIGVWNLSRLAEAMLPVLHEDETKALAIAEDVVGQFSDTINVAMNQTFCRKLGLDADREDSVSFVSKTFQTMTEHKIDFTLFFSRLTNHSDVSQVSELFENRAVATDWMQEWSALARPELKQEMKTVNPIYIPRNHQVEAVIQAGIAGDFAPLEQLNSVLSKPFDLQNGAETFERPPGPDEVVHQTFCGT